MPRRKRKEPEIRTVYVMSAKTAGRMAGAGTYYVLRSTAYWRSPEIPPVGDQEEAEKPAPDDADIVGVL